MSKGEIVINDMNNQGNSDSNYLVQLNVPNMKRLTEYMQIESPKGRALRDTKANNGKDCQPVAMSPLHTAICGLRLFTRFSSPVCL